MESEEVLVLFYFRSRPFPFFSFFLCLGFAVGYGPVARRNNNVGTFLVILGGQFIKRYGYGYGNMDGMTALATDSHSHSHSHPYPHKVCSIEPANGGRICTQPEEQDHPSAF